MAKEKITEEVGMRQFGVSALRQMADTECRVFPLDCESNAGRSAQSIAAKAGIRIATQKMILLDAKMLEARAVVLITRLGLKEDSIGS